ncbi:MAG: 2Fe-2S iron-sulfur cluster-binding protein [Burkholderiales bacterium]
MPTIFVDGREIQADKGQTVLEAALAAGCDLPYFCYHPALSIAGSCRVCVVQVEGRSWVEIACNMPVTEGLRVLTDSDLVREHRASMLELTLLNHPVDCGICDKAGECTLQDYHYKYHGKASVSLEPKVRSTKLHPLSSRIVLDNERCILCSRCVRFTREISKTNALGIEDRGDHSLVRAAEDGGFEHDPYSDNVVDLCPVGALLPRAFVHHARVWYLKATPSVCPGCSRGCTIQLWHRKPEWKLNALDPAKNTRIERITPLPNPAVNGPWICNKARDLGSILERPRAQGAMLRGEPAALEAAIAEAQRLIASARRPLALVSSWGSNEELAAFASSLGSRMSGFVKQDRAAKPGEVVEDALLIRADKNPNTTGALAHFPAWDGDFHDADVVLVWGEGVDAAKIPATAAVIRLGSYAGTDASSARVFLPISIQTERAGHYTNFAGTVSAFERCFPSAPGVADAQALFPLLAGRVGVPA